MLNENKLSLGTAKLGMPNYGYSDGSVLLDPIEFLKKSINLGVKFIDTSPRYGNSELIIGKALINSRKKTFISTKIDGLLKNDSETPNLMLNSIKKSVSRLKSKIDLCYLHQNNIEIISDKYVHEGINLLKHNKLINEVGTSVYSKNELIYTLESDIFDWVQIPVNVLDTSFYRLIIEHNSQIKVAVRSVFLQGALINEKWGKTKIKKHNELFNTLDQVDRLCTSSNLTIQELSLAYLSQLHKINQIIIGTISLDKLRKNLCFTKIKLNESIISAIDNISNKSKSWTNPRDW